MLKERLEREGFHVLVAESGEQALRHYGEGIDPLTANRARMVGTSAALVSARTMLRKIAASPASTVLITGESGTGKDLAARYVHRRSDRARGPFVHITCTALPDTLLESELFGHERGAFTDAKTRKRGLLEEADGGVVFLDEIGDMGPALQAKLLRFLEDHTFRRIGGTADLHPDVRVVAATHRDLQAAIAEGHFREDLFYRISVLQVRLPPLREREGDVELLVSHFVERFNRQLGRRVQGLAPGALALLRSHAWPGNVRELRNAVERAVLLAEGDVLGVEDFAGLVPVVASGLGARFRLPPGGLDWHELERALVEQALRRTGGNQTHAAALLGLNRDQIRYRVEKYGIDVAALRE